MIRPTPLDPASLNGQDADGLQRWFIDVQNFMVQEAEDESNWASSVLQHHVAEPVRLALERIRSIISAKAEKDVPWTWDLLKEALVGANAQIQTNRIVIQETLEISPWSWTSLKETLIGTSTQDEDASAWEHFLKMNKDALTWESLKDTLIGEQAKDVSAWDKFKEVNSKDPLTLDSLKDTLIGEQAQEEGASLWSKFKEANKGVPQTWNTLRETLNGMQAQIGDGSLWERLNEVQKNHRSELIMAAAATGAACFLPMTAVAALRVAGFASTGPVAGSLAAALQAKVGLVAAGTPFAFLQSIAMTPATITVASNGALVGSGVLAAAGALAFGNAEAWFSFTWQDGDKFQPSPELVERLVGKVVVKGDNVE